MRQKLARSILSSYIQLDGMLQIISVDQKVEEMLSNGIQHTDHGSYLSVEPSVIEAVLASTRKEVERVTAMNIQPAILCSPVLRRHLRKIVEQIAPSVAVLSQAEIIPNIRAQSAGKVQI